MNRSLVSHTQARVARALARYLAQPVSRPAASGRVLALSPLLLPGDVLDIHHGASPGNRLLGTAVVRELFGTLPLPPAARDVELSRKCVSCPKCRRAEARDCRIADAPAAAESRRN
jgi:hypothetical protein